MLPPYLFKWQLPQYYRCVHFCGKFKKLCKIDFILILEAVYYALS